MTDPSVLLLSCGSWHLPQTAKAFSERGALAGLWITLGNHAGIPVNKFRRAWPFQAAMLPLYFCVPQIWAERAFYAFLPLWKAWLARQQFPSCNVVQATMGYGTEPFDRAERIGALKVLDCPNSHPVTYHGFWQRECDLWCPGEKIPIPQWMLARMNRELERADIIIVQSDFCKESMMLNGIPDDKVSVNPMGVDTKIFSKRPAVPERVRFVCVGTICLRKGHQYLFRAWEKVKRELPDAELICVGDYKSDFRNERPKWEGRFVHRPALSHFEIADLLKTCTAFVFPSQEEGIGRAQVEALACGVPVIGTHEGGTTTLVDDGVEGLIVRGRDPEHIAAAMIRLGQDRDLNQRMGDAAYKKVAAQNSWQQYGDRLLVRYAESLKDRQVRV
jgi:glycosyltransferase involved in cell wall biosynthesis